MASPGEKYFKSGIHHRTEVRHHSGLGRRARLPEHAAGGGAIMAAEFPPTGPCNVYIVRVEELERTSSRPQ